MVYADLLALLPVRSSYGRSHGPHTKATRNPYDARTLVTRKSYGLRANYQVKKAGSRSHPRQRSLGCGKEPPAALNAALAPLIEQGRLSQPEPGVVAPAGFYSSPSTSEFLVLRNAVQASLTQPRRPAEVSRLLGIRPGKARSCLHDLVRKGVAMRVGYGLYGMPDAALPLVPTRPQPVRDAILACLSQPRRVVEVAAYIGRPGSITTGHLGAMKRLGLVVQVERGVYARPGQHKTRQLSLSVAA